MLESLPAIVVFIGLGAFGFWMFRQMTVSSDHIADQMPHLVERPPASRGRRFQCWMGMHEWTSRIELGAKPEVKGVQDVVGHFFAFSAPVCKHCPTQLTPLQ